MRQLLKQEFAVVLLDVNMPGLDGFETAAIIRQRRSCEHTPIIFITSYGDQSHAVRGYSLGAVDYILAPVDPEILKTKVLVFVELFRKTAEIRRQARVLEHRARQCRSVGQFLPVIGQRQGARPGECSVQRLLPQRQDLRR